MRIKFISIILSCVLTLQGNSQRSLAEKLGYSEQDKLLIIHADDMGVSHSVNIGTFLAMKAGSVNSGSIMMPCAWVQEVVDFKKENPDADLGLHLTLTNEWKHMRWGPLAGRSEVPSIVTDHGFLKSNCLEFGQTAVIEDVEKELRAQIVQAISMGLAPTHLDTHMGCLIFSNAEIFEAYLKLGREFKIPAMVDRMFIRAASQSYLDKITEEDIIIEKIYTANIPDYESGLAAYYEETLKNLSTGVQILLIHTGFDNAEMQAMTIDHEPWGAKWRQQDFDFFTSTKCKKILEEENIKLITWRDIQKVWYHD